MARQNTTDPLTSINQALAAREGARAELARVRAARQPLDELTSTALANLGRRAEEGRERLEFWARSLNAELTLLAGEHPLTLENAFCALHRDQLAAVISGTLTADQERHLAADGLIISRADRAAAVETAESAAFAAEQAVEAAYEAAEQAGHVVERVADLAPEAVLGIDRGAKVPHDYHGPKVARIMAARAAAMAAMAASRNLWVEARNKLGLLETRRREATHEARYADELAAWDAEIARAATHVEQLRADLDARSAEAQPRIALAHRIEEYTREHRSARPCRPVHNPQLRHPGDPTPPEPLPWRERFADDADQPAAAAD